MEKKNYSPIVQELLDLIEKNGWEKNFKKHLMHAMH